MNEKTFAAIEKLKEVELELYRLKHALEMANKALDAKCEWVGLTEQEMDELVNRFARYELVHATAAKLREKNGG